MPGPTTGGGVGMACCAPTPFSRSANVKPPLLPPRHVRHATVFYDGRCGMCTGLVEWALPRSADGAVRFVDNASPEGQSRLLGLGLLRRSDDTLIADVEGDIRMESAAMVAVTNRLRWPYRAATAMAVVPRPLRDWGYRQVAKRRSGSCAVRRHKG